MPPEDDRLVQAAGLDKAWRDHPEDVREAIAIARKLAGAFARPTDPAAEPIPPYAAPAAPRRKAARR